MLKRQKTILATLLVARRPVLKTELVKWIFLMRQETNLGTSQGFYEFLPYKYGPFSFQLYRDVSDLERNGYALVEGDQIRLGPIDKAADKISSLNQSALASTTHIVNTYEHYSVSELIDTVYDRYRWYSVLSQRPEAEKYDRPTIPEVEPAVFTIGYEGMSIDGFFDHLLRKGIKQVVDVRFNPLSRKYGFSKKTLDTVSRGVEIGYLHLGNLGIPPSYRSLLESPKDYVDLFRWYDESVLNLESECIDYLADSLIKTPSALMCYEKNAESCHRSRISLRLSAMTGLDVMNI